MRTSTAFVAYLNLIVGCGSRVSAFLGRGNDNSDDSNSFADCNGCFCIPDGTETCPSAMRPETDFSEIIPTLQSFRLMDPLSLTCDPYSNEDGSCPPPSEEKTGVCVVEIEPPTILGGFLECPKLYSYSLKTYAETLGEAQTKGRYVTHTTPCGYCSSLQDLAVYMEQGPNLQSGASQCGFQGLLGQEAGTRCFQKLGFTEPCATMWYYNTQNTRDNCFLICALYTLLGRDPNKPDCQLAKCIECDETNSGPAFDRNAGRTRRNSGLLSSIARPCGEMVPLEQPDPCDMLE